MGAAAIWAAFRALGIWKRVAAAFAWLTASATNLLIAGCVILAAWGVYQRHEAAKYHRAYDSASAALKSAQIVARELHETSTTLAKDNTHDHETRASGDIAATRVYIAANRVQVSAKPAASGQSTDPGVPVAQAPVLGLVAVRDSDVEACTVAYDQALDGALFMQGLVDKGLGEVAK